MPRPAIQVRVCSSTQPQWCWVLQAEQGATNYPLLIQYANGARMWVGINEITAAKASGKELGTRALWDLLKLPEPTTGNHFFY